MILAFLIAFLLPLIGSPPRNQAVSPVDKIAIEVMGRSREFAYTNKESAYFYGETNAPNSSSWEGFHVLSHKFLDDYTLTVDGVPLDRSSASQTIVYPDYLVRTYPNGVTEQLRMVDSLALFAVIVTSQKPVELGVIPWVSDGPPGTYTVEMKEEAVLLARRNHLQRTQAEDYPVWLAIHGKGFLPSEKVSTSGALYSPALLIAHRSKTHILSFAVGSTQEEAERMALGYLASAASYFNHRRARMEKLLSQSEVVTADSVFNRALAWAKISLDALMMNQGAYGIFAGLPWFDNYWGRDTFISLAGATLVTGRFAEARRILRTFAQFQQTDARLPDYGRIPNLVTTTEKAYNTADGTPRFAMMARDYIMRSGDSTFILEIYPTILRSIEGTIKYHVDSLGFLSHGDAETWMDAVGPEGPWSPRGDRANDIQALWAQQLEAGIWFATRLGDVTSAVGWDAHLKLLKRNFARFYIHNGSVADHLTGSGTPVNQLRPNQIFTVPLLSDSMRAKVLHRVVDSLTYVYGVASLSQDDDQFHPFHQYPPFYPKDAAYHNGTVWTWLQGPVIAELCRFGKQEMAACLVANTGHQILDRGAVGTQSELLDALPRPGEKEPHLSGTFSQAWNLAEFVRNFYDDFLGVRVDLFSRKLILRPHIPRAWGSVKARVNLGGRSVLIEVDQYHDPEIVSIDSREIHYPIDAVVVLPAPGGKSIKTAFTIHPRSSVVLTLSGNDVSVSSNGKPLPHTGSIEQLPTYATLLEPLAFALPKLREGLKALKGPDYPLLTNAQVKAENPQAHPLVDATDPVGDDSGHFTYPRNPAFVAGSFDITRLVVTYDSVNAYFALHFRALSNPGWHPEYGFQLTEAIIAVDEDSVAGSGNRRVSHNANYTLDERHAYERLIVIGGGLNIEDDHGNILAAYHPIPSDAANPLGNAGRGTISFAVPLKYLGRPTDSWKFSVLVGAQDDHGGAGIGEFRTVNPEAGEWNGGGRKKADDSNVYDILVAPK